MKIAKIFTPNGINKLSKEVEKEYRKGTPMKEIKLELDFFAPVFLVNALQKEFQVIKNKIAFKVKNERI